MKYLNKKYSQVERYQVKVAVICQLVLTGFLEQDQNIF